MTLQVGLHNPVKVSLTLFESQGHDIGCIEFIDDDDDKVSIYTAPDIAQALADAFDLATVGEGNTAAVLVPLKGEIA